MYSFATPAIKAETGTAYKWGTTNNNKPPGPGITMGQSETLSQQLDHIYYTLFSCRRTAFTSHEQRAQLRRSENQFPELNRHMLDFLHPIVLCRITHRALLEMLYVGKVGVKFFQC
jgi:hypothetical protein